MQCYSALTAPSTETIIALSLGLLRHLQQLKDRNPRLSIESFVGTVVETVTMNNCNLAIKEDTLRKLMSPAYTTFILCEVKASQPTAHGVEECDHISQECPACQGSQAFLKEKALEIASNENIDVDIIASMLETGATNISAGTSVGGGDRGEALNLEQGGITEGDDNAAMADGNVLDTVSVAEASGTDQISSLRGETAASSINDGLGGLDLKRPSFLREGTSVTVMHSLHADGHMGILHLKDQGKNIPSEQLAALRFVQDDDTKAAIANETFAAKGSNLKECSDFRADKEDGKKSASFDRTGVLAVGCRHGFVLAMCNLFTGE